MNSRITTLILVAALAIGASAQTARVDFDCQSPACTYVFPAVGSGSMDCEGVSHNGNGVATVDDGVNGLGFPSVGGQYLRLVANGPEDPAPGVPPTSFTSGLENSVFVPVPSGASRLDLDWDFYCEETPGGTQYHDGMLIDFIDVVGTQLAVVAFADCSLSTFGSGTDAGNCGAAGTNEFAPVGLNHASASVPAGAVSLRITVWNAQDNVAPSHGVVDTIRWTAPGGADFELQGPACTAAIFPPAPGAFDPEGIYYNGGTPGQSGLDAGVGDTANSAGFPTSGGQFLRVTGSAQLDQVDGVPPTSLPAAVVQVFIPVPSTGVGEAVNVDLDWDFYDAETDDGTFNDAAMIDVVDAMGNQLAVVAYGESLFADGPGFDSGGCSVSGFELGATTGPEQVRDFPLPPGAAFLRCSQWNHNDTAVPSMLVVDDVVFTVVDGPLPGTGEDLELVTRKNFSPLPFDRNVFGGEVFGFTAESPLGTFVGEDFIFLGQVGVTGSPFGPPSFPGLNVDIGQPGIFTIATAGLGFPLLLPPGGVTVDFGPAVGLAGVSVRIQGIVPTAIAVNGIFVATDSHELRFE